MTPQELIHAMAERSMAKLRIAFVLPGGVYTYLSAQKSIQMEDGGPTITNPLLVGGNPNVGTATYYDHVPVARTSELTTVKYDLTRFVGTYVMSEQEVDENAGKHKLVDIAAAKMRALEIAMKQYQRTRAVGTNIGKDPNGLGNLFPSVNTSGTIGNINLATQPMFRHEVYDFTAVPLTKDTIEEAFDDILVDMQNDEGSVTVIFLGRNLFTMHRNAARAKYSGDIPIGGFGTKLANLGLTGTTHQQIPIVYDEKLDPDVGYFLNENEVMIHILKNANMKMKDLTAPYDQDVLGKRYIMEYQFCTWKMHRTHATIING
jgi:hypothetical protein